MAIDLSIIDSVERVQSELHDAIPDDLLDFWFVCNRLLARWRHPNALCETTLSKHHARVALWMQQQLFSKRNKPLISKGVLRELTTLSHDAEETLRESTEFRAEASIEHTMLQARLGLIHLAPGLENRDLAMLASDLESLLKGTSNPPWPTLPDTMLVSLEAITDAMERDVQTERLTFAATDRASFEQANESDEIPDLQDF